MFQATKAEKDDTRKLVHTINLAIGDHPVTESNLDELFDAMWPKLEEKLRAMPAPEENVVAKRDVDEMIAEILEINRAEANRKKKSDSLDAFIPLFDELLPILPQIQDALRTAKNQLLVGSMSSKSSGISSVTGSLSAGNPAENNGSTPSDESIGWASATRQTVRPLFLL